ncbi:MAG: TonB-dependent receptor [Desulfobulbus sp.]|nr:TonB-dependent receptor [Desulfobulbus sp.]
MTGNYLRCTSALLGLTLMGAPGLRAETTTTSTSLDEMVVTASSAKEAKKEVTSNITVITEEDIKKSTASDLGQLLNQNGFQTYATSGNGSGSTALYIRGIGNSSLSNELEGSTLILLNGHRTGTSLLNLKDLGNVERIEIIRGPAAVQYGTSSMGGVVNIITKRGEEGYTVDAEVGMGSYSGFNQKLSMSGAKNGFDFAGAITNSKVDDYRTGTGATWKHTSVGDRLGLDLDAGYTFSENHRIGAHFNYFKMSDGELPGGGWPDTSVWPDNFDNYDNTAYNTTLSYEGHTGDKMFSWAADYTFGQYESKSLSYYDQNYPYTYGAPVYPVPNYRSATTTDLQQGQARVTFDNKLLMLTAGFDAIKYDLDADNSYNSSKAKSVDYAGYLLGKLRLFDEKVIVSAGGRYDSYENTDEVGGKNLSDSNFSPSIGLAWLPVNFLKLRANYAEGFHMPTPAQMVGDSYYYAPSPGLKPETSQGAEVGADVSWKCINAGLTYFHTNYKDKIAGLPSGLPYPQPNYIYGNLAGDSVYAGFELSFGADLGKAMKQRFKLRPYVNITLMTQRDNGDQTNYVPQDPGTLPYVPKMTASYGLDFNHPDLGLSANLNLTYFGKSYQNDWNVTTNPTYETKYIYYGGFTVVNLSLEQKLVDFKDKGTMSLRAAINNLFNQDYAYVMDYPMPGRNFYVGLAYHY